jgi:hypothetical protein
MPLACVKRPTCRSGVAASEQIVRLSGSWPETAFGEMTIRAEQTTGTFGTGFGARRANTLQCLIVRNVVTGEETPLIVATTG